MFQLCRRSLAVFAAACTFAIFGFTASPAQAQQKPVIKVSSLTLPVFNPLVWNIMKARGIDAKHGFELDAKAYPSISAFYAAFATGETDVLIGGPTILQKLYQEGVPVRIIATGFTLADLVIFAKDEKIKSLADLKGKQLAIDMGGSQFQVTKIYANAKGIDLGKDIIAVNANFAVARAQLELAKEFEMLVSQVNKMNMVLDIHTELEEMEYIIQKFPQATIVFPHFGDGHEYEHIWKRIQLVAKHPNTYLDTSGTGHDRVGMLEVALLRPALHQRELTL